MESFPIKALDGGGVRTGVEHLSHRPMPSGPFTLFLFAFCALGFWGLQLADALTRRFDDPSLRWRWALVVLLLPLLGAAVYAFWGRPNGHQGTE